MKNVALLFFLLLSLLLNPLTAQEYIPMLEVGKIWNMQHRNDYGYYWYFNVEITEQVQINGNEYFKIESRNDCEIFMREDIIEKKVYRLMNGQDVLMFDFGLDVGDNAPNNFVYSPFAFGTLIYEIGVDDFFNIPDLNYYGFEYQALKMVESIGLSSTGILNCFDEGCMSVGLYEWDTLVSMNEILSLDDYVVNNIDIFYNSKTNMIQLLNTSEEIHLELYTVLGQKVISTEVVVEKYLPNLSSGVYIYQISKGQSIKTGKILVR